MKAISINAWEIENNDGETLVFMTPEEFEFIQKYKEKADKEIERLHSIIKEVREYIENNTKEGPIKDKRYFYSPEQANDILGILDKENK